MPSELLASTETDLIMDRCEQLAKISSQPDRLERVHLSPEHTAVNALVAHGEDVVIPADQSLREFFTPLHEANKSTGGGQ